MIKKWKYSFLFRSFFVSTIVVSYALTMCRVGNIANLRRKRTIVLFVSPHLYPPFSRLASRDSSSTRALRIAKGLQRTVGPRGSSTRAARLRIDRSCSPFVMSRCNHRVTDTGEETRERLTETRAVASFIILKPFKTEIQFWRWRRRRRFRFAYVRQK